jgi:hypothetical protein
MDEEPILILPTAATAALDPAVSMERIEFPNAIAEAADRDLELHDVREVPLIHAAGDLALAAGHGGTAAVIACVCPRPPPTPASAPERRAGSAELGGSKPPFAPVELPSPFLDLPRDPTQVCWRNVVKFTRMAMAEECPFSYQVAPNAPAGGWRWEVVRSGKIIACGVAVTDIQARVAALAAALAKDHTRSSKVLPASKPLGRQSDGQEQGPALVHD